MKIKQKTNMKKKVLAIIFSFILLFQIIQPSVLAISSSGTGQWVAGQWDSNIYTTDNNGSVGMLLRRLVNYTTGERVTVFCGEHFINSPTGVIETGTQSIPTDPSIKYACKIAYFGWYSKYGNWVMDGSIMASSERAKLLDYVFTQQFIWESMGQSSATFKDSSLQSQYVSFKSEISNKIANMERKPSFCNSAITIDAGTSKTLTDSNNVLKDYNSIDKTTDGIRVTHTKGENTMTITISNDCKVENYRISEATMKSWGVIKEETADNDTTVYITFKDGVQNQLYSLNYNDPVTMSLELKINLAGNLELSKLNEGGNLVDGAVFRVQGNNYSNDVTIKNGKLTLEKIKAGTYTIQEISAPYRICFKF